MLVSCCIIVLGNENLGIIWPRNAKKQKWNWLIFSSTAISSLQGQGTKQVLCGLQCYSWVCHWFDLSLTCWGLGCLLHLLSPFQADFWLLSFKVLWSGAITDFLSEKPVAFTGQQLEDEEKPNKSHEMEKKLYFCRFKKNRCLQLARSNGLG